MSPAKVFPSLALMCYCVKFGRCAVALAVLLQFHGKHKFVWFAIWYYFSALFRKRLRVLSAFVIKNNAVQY